MIWTGEAGQVMNERDLQTTKKTWLSSRLGKQRQHLQAPAPAQSIIFLINSSVSANAFMVE